MIKTIVFDLGGVLFTEGKAAAAESLVQEYGYDRAIVGGVMISPESVALRKGLISDEEFWRKVEGCLPDGYDAAAIRTAWYEGYRLDRKVLRLIKELRAILSILAFSGNIRSRVDYLDAKYDFRRYFDKEIYSFDFHLDKPQRAFVEVMLANAGCAPEEIAYVDDEEAAVIPARELGVHAILYRTGKIETLRAALRSLGIEA